MGLDISYKDLLDLGAHKTKYNPIKLMSTNLNGEERYLLTITAKNDNISYARQDLFVQKNYLVRKIVMCAKECTKKRVIK